MNNKTKEGIEEMLLNGLGDSSEYSKIIFQMEKAIVSRISDQIIDEDNYSLFISNKQKPEEKNTLMVSVTVTDDCDLIGSYDVFEDIKTMLDDCVPEIRNFGENASFYKQLRSISKSLSEMAITIDSKLSEGLISKE